MSGEERYPSTGPFLAPLAVRSVAVLAKALGGFDAAAGAVAVDPGVVVPLAAAGLNDTLVTQLDWLAWSLPDARDSLS